MQSLSLQSIQLISISCKVLRFTHPGPAHGPAPSTAWHLPGVPLAPGGWGWGEVSHWAHLVWGTALLNGEQRALSTALSPCCICSCALGAGHLLPAASWHFLATTTGKKHRRTVRLHETAASATSRSGAALPAGSSHFVSLPLPDKKGWGQAQALQRAEAGACSAQRVWSYQPPENPCLALPVCCSYWFGLSWAISNNEEHIWESYSLL